MKHDFSKTKIFQGTLTPWPLSQEERGDYGLVIRFFQCCQWTPPPFWGGWEGVITLQKK